MRMHNEAATRTSAIGKVGGFFFFFFGCNACQTFAVALQVMRPVERTEKVKGKKPVQVKKMVKTKVPQRKVEQVNVTQPEMDSYEADVQARLPCLICFDLSTLLRFFLVVFVCQTYSASSAPF